MASSSGPNAKPEKTLVSWKEIAAFFDRAERTVKRWERERGLPVHRVPGGERGGVYAYPGELSDWLRGRSSELEAEEVASGDRAEGNPPDSAMEGAGAPPGTVTVPSPSQPQRTVRLTRLAAWFLPLGLTGALIFYFSFTGGHRDYRVTTVGGEESASSGASGLDPDAVAVLPFSNVKGDPNSDYLCDGITESLIGNLVHIPYLKFRSRDAVFRLKGKDLEVRQAGSKLGVARVVSGRVTVEAGKLEISTEITDVRDNTEVWGKRYDGRMPDIVRLQEQIAGDIAKALRSGISSAETQRVTHQGTQDAEAYALYLKGRYAWNRRGRTRLEDAVSFLNQAIERDPNYALAYSGLADVYAVLPNFRGNLGGDPNEDFPRSNAAAHKALELDPTLAHPHAVLGANLTEYSWDFAGGEAEFRKAIALDPNDATAHQWYSEEIGQLGRHEEAWAEINRAHELDPLSPVISRVMGGTLLDWGQTDRAIQVCTQLVRENPTFSMGHDCLFYVYWTRRMYPRAIEEFGTASQLTGNLDDIQLADAMKRGFLAGGWKTAMAGAVALLEARREKAYVSPFVIARFYADMGATEKAFEWLDVAYREHDRLLIGLNVSPGFDNLRSDSRFTRLVHNVGLPTTR